MLMNTHKRRIQEFFSCGLFLSGLMCVDLWSPPVPASAQQAPHKSPPAAASSIPGLSPTLDALVEKAVAAGEIPGAVLLVSHRGRVLHRKAYGSRALLPKREPMTVEDRKSTRLNSSHGYISYAVFCLKKKKEEEHVDAA